MNPDFIEVSAKDLCHRSPSLASDLAQGQVVIVRDVGALRRFRDELIKTAHDGANADVETELRAFYDQGAIPGIESLHALVKAVKSARDERYLSECLAPLVREMGFEGPVLVDGGLSRLVLPEEVIDQTRLRSDLFVSNDYQRETAQGPIETFMAGPSNIHRDFDRDHYLLMCNIWAPLHDVGAEEIVCIYPKCYRQPIHSMPNTAENRQKLGEPVRVALRFGDCIVFHSENIHHSPNPQGGKGRRHSYELRIAAGCPDDNSHYRYNFAHLVNFATANQDFPSLLSYRAPVSNVQNHYAHHGPQVSANFYWRCLEREPIMPDTLVQILNVFDRYPFAEDRYLALARRAAQDGHPAGDILAKIVGQTNLYFFALKCAEEARELGRRDVVGHACEKVLELVKTTPSLRRFAPIDYLVPAAQLLPAEAGKRAEALLAELKGKASVSSAGVHRGWMSKLLRFFKQSA